MTRQKPANATSNAKERARLRQGGTPARSRQLRAQGRKTLESLLDAGLVVFDERGYTARVDDVAKKAGTSHGTFYLYFESMDELLEALVAESAAEMLALAEEFGAMAGQPCDRGQLRAWLDRYAVLYAKQGPIMRTWTQASVTNRDFARLGRQYLRDFTARIANCLADAQLSEGLDPDTAALVFVAATERVSHFHESGQTRESRDRLLDALTTFVYDGLFAGS